MYWLEEIIRRNNPEKKQLKTPQDVFKFLSEQDPKVLKEALRITEEETSGS